MKTKDELVTEYLACTSAETIAEVKEAMLTQVAETTLLDAQRMSRLGRWFDTALAESMTRVAVLLSDQFTAVELQRLIDMRKDPLSQRMEALTPQLMVALGEQLQRVVSGLDELLSNPEKLEEVLLS